MSIADNGEFHNIDAITGLEDFRFEGSGTLTVTYGHYADEYEVFEEEVESNTVFNFTNIQPHYIKIENKSGSPIDITNMTFNYTCAAQDLTSPLVFTAVNNTSYKVTGCNGNPASIEVPDTYNGKPVTAIDYQAFSGVTSIVTAKIGSNVTSMGTSVFNALLGAQNLKGILVSNSNQTYSSNKGVLYSKDGTKLILCPANKAGTFIVPNDVNNLSNLCFFACQNLKEIIVGDHVTTIEQGIFMGCTSLESLYIPFIGKDITKSEYLSYFFALQTTNLNSANLPESLKSVYVSGHCTLKEEAFTGAAYLEEIYVPNAVMAPSVFKDVPSLRKVCVSYYNDGNENNKTFGRLFGATESQKTNSLVPETIKEVIVQQDQEVSEGAFSQCRYIEKVTFNGDVYDFGKSAFSLCYALKEVNCKNASTTLSIGQQCFYGCSELLSFDIPNGTQTIKTDAFYNCHKLAKVYIPDSVTSIESYILRNCEGLKEIRLPYVGTSLASPNTFVNMIGSLASSLTNLEKVDIGNLPTSIPECAFKSLTGIKQVKLGTNVTTIEREAFCGCTSLENITMPDTLTTIGQRAFAACHLLELETLPSSLTTLDSDAFSGADSLIDITIPEGVEVIGGGAFYECENLTSVTLPSTITEVGHWAFEHAPLENVYFDGTIEQWCNITFVDLLFDNPGNLYIKNDSGDVIHNGKTYSSVSFVSPSSAITEIKYGTFANVSNIKYFASSYVTSVGKAAFAFSGLLGFMISPNATSLSTDVLTGCESIQVINTPIWGPTRSDSNYISYFFNGQSYNDNDDKLPESLTKIIINGATGTINDYSFYGCKYITHIQMSNSCSVTEIGQYAFASCTNLERIDFSEGVQLLDDYYASGSNKLKYFTFPSTLTYIGGHGYTGKYNGEAHYNGTIAQFKAITKGDTWIEAMSSLYIECTDGTIVDAHDA